jgi:hypothetical protein
VTASDGQVRLLEGKNDKWKKHLLTGQTDCWNIINRVANYKGLLTGS